MRPTSAIVAHYASEPGDPLWPLATAVQRDVASALGDDFLARDPRTVHTTVLGLDDTPAALHAPLTGLVREQLAAEPLRLQVGGWPDVALPVSSRGRRLHERTLSRFGRTVVLLAWPVDPHGVPTTRLDALRRALVAAGGRHRYPLDEGHLDPDAHLVIGVVRDDADLDAIDAGLQVARTLLAQQPRHLDIGPDDLSVVTYDDPTLPPATTRVVRPWT
ncbi:hypothetical protein [Nocardioides aequoreus]|uniref:hypothetical protein n=1 Tax=Nocardioides aequoreus TaxID=397278 RepID=UPI0004C32613|nr:hypothetical protein [Nocardioides aequoreus]